MSLTLRLVTLAVVSLIVSGCAGGAARSSSATAAPAKVQSYKIDPGHTSVVFKISHLGTSDFFGRFNNVSGTLQFSDDDLANSSIRVVAEAGSVDTNSADRDSHVKSPELFDIATHPQIMFEGSGFRKLRGNAYKVNGNLTFHGVTQPITVTAVKVGTVEDERFGNRVGFTTTFTIHRSDFGMGAGMPTTMLGDEVQVMVGVEAILEK